MHRVLVPAVLLSMFLGAAVSAQETPAVYLAIGPQGGVRILKKTEFSAGAPKSGSPVDIDAAWLEVVRHLGNVVRKAPKGPETPEEAPAPTPPIYFFLRWIPTVEKCKVYVGRVLCQYDEKGIERAAEKIELILEKGNYDVIVNAAPDVPARWVLAALETASKKKPRRVLASLLPEETDPAFYQTLETLPAFDPKRGRRPRADVRCVVHPDAPFKALARLLAACNRTGIRTFRVGSSSKTLLTVASYDPGAVKSERAKWVEAMGGSRKTETAVQMGLIWLKNHQDPDGSWSCKDFSLTCKHGTCGGAGSEKLYDTGVTSLALLAFLGAGNTHKHGRFKKTVLETLKGMRSLQASDGCVGPKDPEGRWIYNHAIATLALTEAYGLSNKSELLKPMAQKAVDFLVECRNPGKGWRYGRRPGESDTSCTAWAVSALVGAKISGLEVPLNSFDGALNWFDSVTDKGSWRTGYKASGDRGARHAPWKDAFASGEGTTAAAIFARILIQKGKASGLPPVEGGAALLRTSLPRWDVKAGTIDMAYWYWGTNAAFQLGDPLWKPWNEAMKSALLPTQRRDGCATGSWDPVGAWGAAGGRVYATAVNTLTLEVYYRYGRMMKGR